MPVAQPASFREWERAGGKLACRGVIRSRPEDFRVTELLEPEFADSGEHDWLWIEKRSTNTGWLAGQLAGFAGVPIQDVGFAGHKDRHAVCRQWFSVRRRHDGACDWRKFACPGARLIEVRQHGRKLRRGAHRGNQFVIVVRDLLGNPEDALQRVAADGVPNYFGEQRFGSEGANIRLARAFFSGRRLRRDKRSLAISAARSLIFNEVLDRRVRDRTWNCLLRGERVMLAGSRSYFVADTVDEELRTRCKAFDLHPTGPLWGRAAGKESPSALECDVAAEFEDLAAGLEKHAEASRRPLRAILAKLRWTHEKNTLQLEFELPSGAFATAALREIALYDDRSRAGASTAPQ